MVQNVLIVCIGNICRSPMAAAMLKNALGEQSDVSLGSAGLGAMVGHPADDHAIALMHERGLDISDHRARQLEPALIKAADLVLVMESGHRQRISELEPATRGKVYRLCEWTDEDVPDPYKQPRAAFEEALVLIEKGVRDWAEKINIQAG